MRGFKCAFALLALQAATANAAVIVSENYEGGVSGWSNSSVVNPGANGGGFTSHAGLFGNETISRTLTFSGTQTNVDFAFDFLRIDSWDGEQFRIEVLDGATVLYDNATPYYHGNGTNHVWYGWDDAIHARSFSLAFSGAALTMRLSSTLDQGALDESWGIDNFVVTDNSTGEVPEPAMLGLFGLGAIGLGLARRRKA